MWIDVSRLLARRLKGRLPTGVDRVALAYVERFGLPRTAGAAPGPGARALLRMGRLHLTLPPAASRLLFQWLTGDRDGQACLSGSALAARLLMALLAALADAWRAPAPTRAQPGSWLIHAAHSGLEHPHWASRLRAQGARPLLVIHDLIPITHPQFCRAGEGARHARRMRHALNWAAAVVANSQATLDALAAWARAEDLPMPAATVAHLGPGGAGWGALVAAAKAGGRPLAEPYFVVLGTLEPRKNHALLLKVWDRLVQQLGAQAAPRLVLVGQRGWEIESLLRDLDRTLSLQGVVLERQHCSDAELAGWLAHAQALLLPSFVEGFGMPLIEALAAGVPVLASDLPVYREVAAAMPEYLDPLDGPAWLAAVQAYARNDGPERQAQVGRLQAFRAPSWAEHFEVVEALMASASASPPQAPRVQPASDLAAPMARAAR